MRSFWALWLGIAGWTALPAPGFAQPSGSPGATPVDEAAAARGMRLLQMQGCLACHSTDGTASAGPSFQGRFGGQVEVQGPDGPHTLRFDRDYLERSLREPDALIARGFPRGVMPRFELSGEQIDAMAAGLRALSAPQPDDGAELTTALWTACAAALCLVAVRKALRSARRTAGPRSEG